MAKRPSEAARRVIDAIRKAYGTQAEAAAALDEDISKLSRIAQGKQLPDFELLMKLAFRPGIDVHRLLTGAEPEGRRGGRGGEADCLLPLSRWPVPTQPLETPSAFDGVVRVARTEYRKSRYALRLHDGNLPLVARSREYFPGDLLVVETDVDVLRRYRTGEEPAVIIADAQAKATLVLPGDDDRGAKPSRRGYPRLVGVGVTLTRRFRPDSSDDGGEP